MAIYYYTIGGKLLLSGGKAICSYIPPYLTMFISAGLYHSILIKTGQVWCWGYNTQGQLGDNTVTQRLTPVSILGTKKTFCEVVCGRLNTIGVDKNGQVWGWGYNGYGQLGDNTITNRCTPVSILGTKKTFCKLGGGYQHTIGIDKNGQVWSWGQNTSGQLGDNTITSRLTPVSIQGNKTFYNIAAGFRHTIGLDKNGQVWCWGYNTQGQLGDNTITSRRTPVSIIGSKKTFCIIAAGTNNTMSIDKNGQVWGWGYNGYGQLGDNTITNRCTPVSIIGTKKTFCNIASGGFGHTIGIDKIGQVWGWGYNSYGQIGDNTLIQRLTPVSILGTKKTFCKIFTGQFHTIGIDKYGQVWCWGRNDSGQLGDNMVVNKCTPVSIIGSKKTFCIIAAGTNNTMSIDKNGQVWGWGYNSYGQIGDNTAVNKYTPVSILGSKKTFCKIDAGKNTQGQHTEAIDNNGLAWSWGDNRWGQLGDNTIISRRSPVSMLGSKKTFCTIIGGQYHTIGLDKNGQVWGCGRNTSGQIGDNTITSQRTPVSILGIKKTFCTIFSGGAHTIGIDKTGQVWGWGGNSTGIIGDNSTTQRLTPVSIQGTKKTFCNISAVYHTIGLDKNGQVWGWGQNTSGQLGDNTITNKCTPVSIIGTNKTFCNISAGYNYTITIDKYGQVWGWGNNNKGQLGDNSITSRRTPVSILGIKKTFCKISGGLYHTIAIDYNGQVWGWGYNSTSQLTTDYNSTTPLRVCNF